MLLDRRRVLTAATTVAAGAVVASCASSGGKGDAATSVRHSYGSDRSQYAELYLPESGHPPATAVIIHGGFWRSAYDAGLGRSLAEDLAARGYAAWNLEYRRVGDGGGWPGTFADVAAGIDLLADVGRGLDPARVVAIGHSAGGQLAAWAAARQLLPAGAPGAKPRILLRAVVAQAGVLDLATAAIQRVGGSAVPDLMGGLPPEVRDRYRVADPIELVPLGAPLLAVHSRADSNVPFAQSQAYVAAARHAGGTATLHEVGGDHFTLIDARSADWKVVVDALPGLLR